MSEEGRKRKTGHSSDQWFKLTKTSKERQETSRGKTQKATEKGRNKKKWADHKIRGRTRTKKRSKERGRTNSPKVIGKNKICKFKIVNSLKLFHS